MAQPLNETKSTHKRWTVDRREITYHLEVVQQPEKARACGSGPRSSADRRPVDPPPVVELRVFANDVDVTMSYDATFMLYASLEVARPIAAGKLHTPQTIPVLTGVAVASAAYLERPRPAAYFIFPDLSVRHEGWYRLKFSLFEGVKHEMDAELGKPFVHPAPSNAKYTPPVRHESMANRLEVQSIPFQVYSAKKFPGLNSSTTLSKLVAEQGCRVRIRREIRQRRRGGKQADVDADEAHSSYHGTPQTTFRQLEHSRSASRNSLGSQYEADVRRASIDSMSRHPTLQSRQPSISAMSMSSPGLPTPGNTSSMPPPPPSYHNPNGRHGLESPPAHSPFSTTATPYQPPQMNHHQRVNGSLEFEGGRLATLPPLVDNRSNSGNPPRRELYETRDYQPVKRHATSRSYDASRSLKDRARPDFPRPTPSTSVFWNPELGIDGANQVIEADNGEDDEFDDFLYEGPMSYPRADGSQANKNARIANLLR